MARIFGTDGARGIANAELSCELAMDIGRAAACVLAKTAKGKPKFVIGKDTRISSDMLEAALTAGLLSVGADVLLLSTVPTPAVSYLVKRYKADAGIMISASHNPAEYNGIKLFNGDGCKLPDEVENEIEALILDKKDEIPVKIGGDLGRVELCTTAVKDYTDYLASTVGDLDLTGMKVIFDCSNGSSSATARQLFTRFGAECEFISDVHDGININLNCGSTHMETLQKLTKEGGYDIGFAFDGDADRCLAVDSDGELIDGDKIIAIFSKFLKEQGRLKKDTAVVTVMTNIGFKKFAAENGVNVALTKVGDRYVLEEMLKKDYNIGGEQSGHIIFLDYASTGDGQMTALWMLKILAETKKTAKELASVMEVFPQVLVNVRVENSKKGIIDTDAEIKAEIDRCAGILGANGRVLIRASGTEPLVRVMLEGQNVEEIQKMADSIANKIKEKL